VNFFLWVEQLPLSVWVRESPSLLAFPFILFLHTLGLAMLAGISVAIDIWLLSQRTIGRAIPMTGFFRVMWLGFGVNAISGIVLLAAYPAKALTNPVFYVKLLLIVLALISLERIRTEMFATGRAVVGTEVTRAARLFAIGSLVAWAGTVFTGRLLAYTHHILLVSDLT
jgi:hypothetical protein